MLALGRTVAELKVATTQELFGAAGGFGTFYALRRMSLCGFVGSVGVGARDRNRLRDGMEAAGGQQQLQRQQWPRRGGWGRVKTQMRVTPLSRVLNKSVETTAPPPSGQISGKDIAGQLQSTIKSLYVEFLDPEGGRVDYDDLRKSSDFKKYEEEARLLSEVDPLRLSRDERLAFFLNLYNALVIHAFVRLGKPKSVPERLLLYARASYYVGGCTYSLNDIEHGILRGNKKQPVDPLGLLTFTPSDPRYRAMVEPVDPRIHFGLNCGAMSCPPIRFYTADNVEFGLAASTSNFIASKENVRVLPKSRTVYLSQLFKWYQTDFAPSGKDVDLLQWIVDNADPNDAEPKESLLEVIRNEDQKLTIGWLPYDWSLNES